MYCPHNVPCETILCSKHNNGWILLVWPTPATTITCLFFFTPFFIFFYMGTSPLVLKKHERMWSCLSKHVQLQTQKTRLQVQLLALMFVNKCFLYHRQCVQHHCLATNILMHTSVMDLLFRIFLIFHTYHVHRDYDNRGRRAICLNQPVKHEIHWAETSFPVISWKSKITFL